MWNHLKHVACLFAVLSLVGTQCVFGAVGDGDPNWHRIGLVWDRAYRSLYVDEELVATDVELQANFSDNQGKLYIGATDSFDAGSFWSGMIDDVRIYDRVVKP
ncbi:MAG: LamG domain-containing protein [Phycisphaerae bacterium]|nr:LamG domain-containing protein [Phycisphaerae bacterium]